MSRRPPKKKPPIPVVSRPDATSVRVTLPSSGSASGARQLLNRNGTAVAKGNVKPR